MITEPVHLVFPNNAMIKKNGMKTSAVVKMGKARVYHYYDKAYVEWAKKCIGVCAVYKTKHPEIQFPLDQQFNLKCLFYYNVNRKVDLSGLYEGVQDILTGKAGGVDFPAPLYQILQDDSVRFIRSHDESRWILDYVNPRTEIYLQPILYTNGVINEKQESESNQESTD